MWEIIFSIIGFVGTLFNAAMFLVIRCNDLKHLEISVKELKSTIEKTGEKNDVLIERISKMEGICSVCAKK